MASKYLPILEKWKGILKLGDWSIQIKQCSHSKMKQNTDEEHVMGYNHYDPLFKKSIIYLLNARDFDKVVTKEPGPLNKNTQEMIIIHELLHLVLDRASFKNKNDEEIVINQLTQGLLNAEKN